MNSGLHKIFSLVTTSLNKMFLRAEQKIVIFRNAATILKLLDGSVKTRRWFESNLLLANQGVWVLAGQILDVNFWEESEGREGLEREE